MWRGVAIEVGQRFKDARITAFGAPLRTVWIVDRVWQGSDGIEYVRLTREDASRENKTISARALADRKLFVADMERIREQVLLGSIARRFRFFKTFSTSS